MKKIFTLFAATMFALAVSAADFSALNQKIAEAQALGNPELELAIAAATDVADKADATQEEIDQAVRELQRAIDALTPSEWVDVTSQYISQSGFNTNFNYSTVSEAQDLENSNNSVDGWGNVAPTSKGVSGIFEYGAPITISGSALPAAGYDGTTNGGMLVLRPTTKSVMSYYIQISEENPLAAGEYIVEFPFYHIGDAATKMRVQTRWVNENPVPEDAEKIDDVYSCTFDSKASELPHEQWYADSLKFTLTEPTVGKLYLAVAGPSALKPAKGGICIDYVKILYKPAATAIQSVTTKPATSDKAVKAIVNGRLVIIKNGKKFNIAGCEL